MTKSVKENNKHAFRDDLIKEKIYINIINDSNSLKKK